MREFKVYAVRAIQAFVTVFLSSLSASGFAESLDTSILVTALQAGFGSALAILATLSYDTAQVTKVRIAERRSDNDPSDVG